VKARRPVVVVARQPGSASAFVPVLRHLAASGSDVSTFAYPLAAATFRRAGVEHLAVDSFDDASTVLAALGQPEIVLTGTSLDVDDDSRWWDLARAVGAPSVGFVDQWVNYWQRFARDHSGPPRLELLPDTIAVVDQVARDRLLEAGADPRRVVISGTPLLDLLRLDDAAAPARARAQLGVRAGDVLALLVSEPTPLLTATGTARAGWTPAVLAALDVLLEVLGGLGTSAIVALKLHPRERDDARPPIPRTGDVRIEVVADDPVGLLHASDLVVGVQSMMLYEATALGIPAVSLQLTEEAAGDLARHPGIRTATTPESAARALADALAARGERCEWSGGATERFLAAVGIAA
jgi:hypothetical protein